MCASFQQGVSTVSSHLLSQPALFPSHPPCSSLHPCGQTAPASCSINYMTTHSRASRLGCLALVAVTVVLAAACTSSSAQSVRDEIAGFGPSPLLPAPN